MYSRWFFDTCHRYSCKSTLFGANIKEVQKRRLGLTGNPTITLSNAMLFVPLFNDKFFSSRNLCALKVPCIEPKEKSKSKALNFDDEPLTLSRIQRYNTYESPINKCV